VNGDLFVDWAAGCVHPLASPEDQQIRHTEMVVAMSTTPAARVAVGEMLRVVASILRAPQPTVTSWFPKLRTADAMRERKSDLVERPSDQAIGRADWVLPARLGDGANWSAELDHAVAFLGLL
jgi:hypothetical protein